MYTYANKVAWEDICNPKNEGGLGIRNVVDWNQASMRRHLWNIYSRHESNGVIFISM